MKRWGSVKPPSRYINWSHPLTQGLVNGALFTHERGTSLIGVSGDIIAIASGTIDTWARLKEGWAIRDNAAKVWTVATSKLPTDYPYTFVVRGAPRAGNNGTNRRVVGWSSSGANIFSLGWSSTGGTLIGEANSTVDTGVTIGLERLVASCAQVGVSATSRLTYVDGVLKATDTVSRTVTTPNTIRIGDSAGTTFADTYYGLIYNRALTAGELGWLAEDPYCFMVQPKKQWLLGAVSAAEPGVYDLIDSVSGASPNGTGAAVTAAMDTTGATLLIISASEYDSGISGSSVVSDSKANTWTPLTLYVEGGVSSQTKFYYCVPPAGKTGSGHTFQSSGGGATYYGVVCAAAFSGGHSSPFDVENGSEASGVSTKQPGSVTPSQNGELIVVGGCISTGASFTSIDSGMTILENVPNVGGQHIAGALAYKVQTTAAAINPQWTMSGSGSVSAAIATFKAGTIPAGGGTRRWRLLLLGVG